MMMPNAHQFVPQALAGRLVDLTLTLRHGQRGVSFETAKTIAKDGWNARTLHLYSHAGTHMDAPAHFFPEDEPVAGNAVGERTIDCLPLDKCLGFAWVVDIPGMAPRELLGVEHLGGLESGFPAGEGLLLRTGWSRHVEQPDKYRDGLPRVSQELADWMVQHRVHMLGVEPPSVADVNNTEELTRIHRTLLGGGVTIVEGLTSLEALRSPRVFFAALPLKIDGGDGCPCRAFAIDPDHGEPNVGGPP